MQKNCFLILLFLVSVRAESKIFDFKNPSYGAFVGGTYGPSIAQDSAYGGSGGNGVTYDTKEESNYSAEFGFLASTKKLNFKIYAEYLFPKHLTNITGRSGSTALYNLDSDVSVLIPSVALEYAIKSTNSWRWLLGGGYGYAMGNMDNKYTFTSAGTSQTGVSNFEEKSTATSSMYLAYTSFEFQFTDIATMMIGAGYRYLRMNTWSASTGVTGLNGTVASGSTLTNQDGSNRSINLSGPYAGITFRFYFY